MTNKPYSLSQTRRGLKHFAIGRVLVGLTGVTLLLLTIRQLSPSDFGSYVALVAMQEIISLTSSLGLFGFVQRYIPEYRLHGSRRQLGSVIAFALSGRLVTLILACGGLYFLSGKLLLFLGIPIAPSVFQLYLIVIVLEGGGRFIDHIFDALLMQGATQIANLIRTLVKLSGLLFIVGDNVWTIQDVVVWDVIASSCTLIFSGVALWIGLRAQSADHSGSKFNYQVMRRFVAYNYAALLGYQVYGFDTLKLLVTKLIGVSETAAYGLAQSLTDILRRYLPAQLLMGMIRPLIIASYSESRNMQRPLFLANLVLKLNIFLLAPAVAIFVALGVPLLEWLGKGRYPQAYGYVLGFMFLVIIQTLHVVLAILATTAERNDLIMKATWLAMTGIAVALATTPFIGVWGALIAAYVSELGYCLVVVIGLTNICGQPVVAWREFTPLAGTTALTTLAALLLSTFAATTTISLLACVALIGAGYLVLAYLWKPFSSAERDLINKLLPKSIFVW